MRRCRCCYPYNVLALFLFSTLCVCIVCMCAHTPTRIQGVILSKLQVAVSCDSRGSSSLIGTLVRLSKRDYSTQKVVHTACICVYKRSPGNCVCMPGARSLPPRAVAPVPAFLRLLFLHASSLHHSSKFFQKFYFWHQSAQAQPCFLPVTAARTFSPCAQPHAPMWTFTLASPSLPVPCPLPLSPARAPGRVRVRVPSPPSLLSLSLSRAHALPLCDACMRKEEMSRPSSSLVRACNPSPPCILPPPLPPPVP